MKVYIAVETGEHAQILNVYYNEDEAVKQAHIYALIHKVWVNVIEREVK